MFVQEGAPALGRTRSSLHPAAGGAAGPGNIQPGAGHVAEAAPLAQCSAREGRAPGHSARGRSVRSPQRQVGSSAVAAEAGGAVLDVHPRKNGHRRAAAAAFGAPAGHQARGQALRLGWRRLLGGSGCSWEANERFGQKAAGCRQGASRQDSLHQAGAIAASAANIAIVPFGTDAGHPPRAAALGTFLAAAARLAALLLPARGLGGTQESSVGKVASYYCAAKEPAVRSIIVCRSNLLAGNPRAWRPSAPRPLAPGPAQR